jgi:hypothetical protein
MGAVSAMRRDPCRKKERADPGGKRHNAPAGSHAPVVYEISRLWSLSAKFNPKVKEIDRHPAPCIE